MKWLRQSTTNLPALKVVYRGDHPPLLSLISIILLILLSGCSASDELSVDCYAFEENGDQFAETTVVVGEEFTITLCSMRNYGYRWSEQVHIDNPQILTEVSREYEPGRSPMGGIPGKEIWTLQATEPGQAVISLDHMQLSGRNTRGIWTYRLAVTVDPQ